MFKSCQTTVALSAAALVMLLNVGCNGDDDARSPGDTSPGDNGSMGDSAHAGDDDVGAGDSGPTMVSVTFVIDTTVTADGTNTLARVDDSTQTVYVAGNHFGNWGEFNNWDPRISENALTSDGDGIYQITVQLEAGLQTEFKYLMAPSDGSGQGWDNSEKSFSLTNAGMTCGGATSSDCSCTNAGTDTAFMTAHGYSGVAEMSGGLWEIKNHAYTVPADGSTADTLPTVSIQAWKTYAQTTYGYYGSCD